MTSDAKIGLLLGLVFIFVIAFIINGLPVRGPRSSQAEVPANSVVSFADPRLGIADDAQAQADRDWAPAVEPPEPEAAVPAVIEPTTPVPVTPESQPEPAYSHDVRFESPLPTVDNPPARDENTLVRIRNLLQDLTANQSFQGAQTTTIDMNPPAPVAEPSVVQPAPARAIETVARNMEQPKPAQAPFVKPAGKIFIVGEGENLSALAKRAYGLEEGNRIVNVNRIFEANRDVLKSPDEVKAGQKLVVPPPLPPVPQVATAGAKPTVNPNKPSDVLPAELFERLEPLRRSASTQPAPQTPTLRPGTRWYTVQDGDNLWKIASSQLKAGARYEEIAKLNTDLLPDATALDVGMKIRLPVK